MAAGEEPGGVFPKYIARSARIGCVAAIAVPNERSRSSGTVPASTTSRDSGGRSNVRTTAGSRSGRNVSVAVVASAFGFSSSR